MIAGYQFAKGIPNDRELEVFGPDTIADERANAVRGHVVVPPWPKWPRRQSPPGSDDALRRDVFSTRMRFLPRTLGHTGRLEVCLDRRAGGLDRLGVDEPMTMADEHDGAVFDAD
jgi:hypothetical protein